MTARRARRKDRNADRIYDSGAWEAETLPLATTPKSRSSGILEPEQAAKLASARRAKPCRHHGQAERSDSIPCKLPE